MGSLLKPRSPQIDWKHPLTYGLIFDEPLFERGGNPDEDILDRLIGTNVAATWVDDKFGSALDFSGATSRIAYTSPARMNNLAQVSIEALVMIRSTGGGGLGRICQKLSGGTGYFQFYCDNTNTSLDFAAARSTANGVWRAPLPSLNVYHHVVATYDTGSVSNTPSIYVDAVSQAITVNTTPIGTMLADDTNFWIGNRNDNLRNWDGRIAYLRLWNRILNQTEVQELYENPFRIYRRSNTSGLYLPR